MRRASSHSMTPPAPSFRKRLWIGVGLLFTLALVNELAAGQKVWLWGAGLLVGALIGLFIAVRNSNPSNHPAIETLGWIVAAALGIAIVVALPKHVLYTLLKIAIIALLWSGRRRDRCDHHHSQRQMGVGVMPERPQFGPCVSFLLMACCTAWWRTSACSRRSINASATE
jgi:hypothetical protein